MRKINIILFLMILLILWNVRGIYGDTGYSFKHYNTNNGLSQNTVRSIFQDNLGFMWFGTKDGLNRFDGSQFKRFKFSIDGVLSDNVFHRILQDNNDNVWVSTEDGVYIYDIYQEQFSRFNKYTNDNDSINGVVTEMVIDAGGGIWMSVESKGIFYYDKATDLLTLYSFPIVEDGLKMVSLCPDNDQGVWVFPYSSPFLYIDKKTGEITQFNLADDEELLLRAGEIQDVFSDQNNLLFLGTSQKGLIAVNTINKTHRILLDVDAYGEPIFVRAIERVDQNTLWIGTESGVYIYNMLTEDVINLRHNPMMPGSLSDNAIYSVYKDRDGGIWVGSYFGGVNYYSNTRNNFELFYPIVNEQAMHGKRVREICMASGGNLWIGTEDGGLNLFDPGTDKFIPLPSPLRTLHSNVHAILQDKEYTWISTFTKGLSRYNTLTGELVTYVHSDDPCSISHNSTFALCKDRQGVLWVGTLIGIDLYDKEKEYFHHTDYLKGMSIYDIFEDSNGFIWVSTFLNGLHRFDPATKLWKVYTHDPTDAGSLPYNKPTSMFEDSKRRLWVTTQGGGIGLYNRTTDTFFTYNSSNGLPNDVVYQIVEDDFGMLWLSTNHGLVRLDPEKELFVNYTVENGLKTNQFNYKSSFKDSKGNIYFGSLDGFTRFNPANFYISRFKSDPVFTDLFINNQRISPRDSGSPLSQSIMFAESLKLPHDKNSIGLQYATLDYAGLTNRKIYHMLDGFDNEWIMFDDNQAIVYSNLNSGRYELKLGIMIEENNNSIEPIKKLSIVITPPFWLTGWAFMLYSLLLITGILLLWRFFKARNRLKQQNSMRDFEQQKERELYRSKINFFTNVAHEIRTPLTLIKAPLDHILTKDELPEKIEDNLKIMSKNTDRLLDLTNQLLDFRKTESESYFLNLQVCNVTRLIQESRLRFIPLAKQKGIDFEFSLPETDMLALLDKDAFLKILSNLLSNGIKYCDSYLSVHAYIGNEPDPRFHLITENDGVLIPFEYGEEIFKPFIQFDAGEDKNDSGTGIGLALARSLTQLHNGSLELVNNSDCNRFHLILPVGDVGYEKKLVEETKENDLNIIPSTGDTKSTTLLLVDDHTELLEFVSNFLSEYYHILVARNGTEALNMLDKFNVNLIVTDVMMPEMDGYELTRIVKSNIDFSHIPVILLTAKVTNQEKVKGYELGADAYLEKPFSVDVLLARIENLLQNRDKLRESFMKNPFIGAVTVALTRSDEEFIRKLDMLVQENLSESEFNVENMAEHFHMSRASFYRKVKGVLDLTPNEYIKVERLKKAALLLKKSDTKVNEVMYMVGFNSSSYFAKCFQQQFGVLPKDFQEQGGL